MPTRSAAVLTSGTANAAKLLVAALAFTGAYAGFTAYGNATSTARPATSITLSAQELPVKAPVQQLAAPATAGRLTLSVMTGGGPGCAKTYAARTLITDPGFYRWRLVRWSPADKSWRTYLSDHDGFGTGGRAAEWRPRISGNPGWYRVELTADGGRTVRSDRFQVSC
ncbi:hypothetical protein [Nonomuraea antimicrobica]|uniref:hypothetical protein n=1 Tax=Nonomuraea antimicrobica TaxID=561173 RepID=UPI0031ECC9DE